MRAPLLLLVPFVLLGCRDAVVDDPPGAGGPPVEETARPMYLKGPELMAVGQVRNFRAEPIAEATRYRWSIVETSTGTVRGTPDDDPRHKNYNIEAVHEGVVYLNVTALDAEGGVLAYAQKRVVIGG